MMHSEFLLLVMPQTGLPNFYQGEITTPDGKTFKIEIECSVEF